MEHYNTIKKNGKYTLVHECNGPQNGKVVRDPVNEHMCAENMPFSMTVGVLLNLYDYNFNHPDQATAPDPENPGIQLKFLNATMQEIRDNETVTLEIMCSNQNELYKKIFSLRKAV